MSTDRNRLQALVDALPETDLPVAISFLSELENEEIVDSEILDMLDRSLAEPGEDLPLEEVRKGLGL